MNLPGEKQGQEIAAAAKHGRQGDILGVDARPIHGGKEGKRLVGAVRTTVGNDHGVPSAAVPLGHFVEEFAGIGGAAAVGVGLDGAVQEEGGG